MLRHNEKYRFLFYLVKSTSLVRLDCRGNDHKICVIFPLVLTLCCTDVCKEYASDQMGIPECQVYSDLFFQPSHFCLKGHI